MITGLTAGDAERVNLVSRMYSGSGVAEGEAAGDRGGDIVRALDGSTSEKDRLGILFS